MDAQGRIEHLTAYDLELLPTVTILETGEKLPVLSIDGEALTVTAINRGHKVVIPFAECDGGQ